MEELIIKISELNDFIFCPISIYYHHLMNDINTILYHRDEQIKGKQVHENIDKKIYSTSKGVFTSLDVYSHKYLLMGKIDIYDSDNKVLIERKNHVSKIYDGYIFQLYAQYFCMLDMGYEIEKIKIYSYSDNKSYEISLPNQDREMFEKFEKTIVDIRKFEPENFRPQNMDKCRNCVYSDICDRSLA